MTIRFVDLQSEARLLRAQLRQEWESLLDEVTFIHGHQVREFEDHFARYCGTHYAVGCGNGTDALELALRSLELPPGSKVITSTLTFAATVEAIEFAGLEPVLVDCEPNTGLLDVEQALTVWDHTIKVVIPVHLYGRPLPLNTLLSEARNHGAYVIEDACQAHGATVQGVRAGALADLGCFSFSRPRI